LPTDEFIECLAVLFSLCALRAHMNTSSTMVITPHASMPITEMYRYVTAQAGPGHTHERHDAPRHIIVLCFLCFCMSFVLRKQLVRAHPCRRWLCDPLDQSYWCCCTSASNTVYYPVYSSITPLSSIASLLACDWSNKVTLSGDWSQCTRYSPTLFNSPRGY